MTENINSPMEQVSMSRAKDNPPDILSHVQESSLILGGILDLRKLADTMLSYLAGKIEFERTLLFIRDPDKITLKYSSAFPPFKDVSLGIKLKQVFLNIYNAEDDPIIGKWLDGQSTQLTAENSATSQTHQALAVLQGGNLDSLPLLFEDELVGLILFQVSDGGELSETEHELLTALAPHFAIFLSNAYTYGSKVHELEQGMNEARILSQIDEELNATIHMPRVFRMIMDWALRFTNAHAAALALYNEDGDTLRIMEQYGFDVNNPHIQQLQQEHRGGITHRAARNGQSEIVPDVSMDSDYIEIEPRIRSQMSVPIMREERVIAVLTLESTKVNGYTEEHLDFVKRLAQRAGVAVDNARLFTETEMERQKLELILSNIKDMVILVSNDNRILLINQSALAGLNLNETTDKYTDLRFSDVIEHPELVKFFQSVVETGQGMMEEMQLPNGRHYHTQLSQLEGIGWVIVMQDITHFKETDKLKSELLATASHDLKQPLSVMRGYLDLLDMTNEFDERSQRFVTSLNKAISNMQTLIDELLDLARIESGLELEIEEVDLAQILRECIDANLPKAMEKSMNVQTDIPENFPVIQGDSIRISQIFNNLIGNAIKYTPPEGEVRVYAQKQGKIVRVSVQDNGLGISPEDKAQIFDRFYRVRRPETDSIEGTGLGLAIVKSLVEAHQGEIDLISQVNKGSTFHVTLPLEI